MGRAHCAWLRVPAGLHVRYLNKVPAGSLGTTKVVVTSGSIQLAREAWTAVTYIGKLQCGAEWSLNTRWFM